MGTSQWKQMNTELYRFSKTSFIYGQGENFFILYEDNQNSNLLQTKHIQFSKGHLKMMGILPKLWKFYHQKISEEDRSSQR